MKYELNRKYRVTTRSGTTAISYMDYVSHEGVVHLFKNCYRIIHSGLDRSNYSSSNPKHSHLALCNLIVTVLDAVLIEPMELTPAEDLPYALAREGTWWERVTVPYVPLPSNRLSP